MKTDNMKTDHTKIIGPHMGIIRERASAMEAAEMQATWEGVKPAGFPDYQPPVYWRGPGLLLTTAPWLWACRISSIVWRDEGTRVISGDHIISNHPTVEMRAADYANGNVLLLHVPQHLKPPPGRTPEFLTIDREGTIGLLTGHGMREYTGRGGNMSLVFYASGSEDADHGVAVRVEEVEGDTIDALDGARPRPGEVVLNSVATKDLVACLPDGEESAVGRLVAVAVLLERWEDALRSFVPEEYLPDDRERWPTSMRALVEVLAGELDRQGAAAPAVEDAGAEAGLHPVVDAFLSGRWVGWRDWSEVEVGQPLQLRLADATHVTAGGSPTLTVGRAGRGAACRTDKELLRAVLGAPDKWEVM